MSILVLAPPRSRRRRHRDTRRLGVEELAHVEHRRLRHEVRRVDAGDDGGLGAAFLISGRAGDDDLVECHSRRRHYDVDNDAARPQLKWDQRGPIPDPHDVQCVNPRAVSIRGNDQSEQAGVARRGREAQIGNRHQRRRNRPAGIARRLADHNRRVGELAPAKDGRHVGRCQRDRRRHGRVIGTRRRHLETLQRRRNQHHLSIGFSKRQRRLHKQRLEGLPESWRPHSGNSR